jgi:phosphoglycolate phosphatase-like HAD superfamily hydrolase
MMINTHFIFDFDGVLSDSLSVALQEVNRLAKAAYPMLPPVRGQEDMVKLFSGPLRSSLQRFGLSKKESEDFFDAHSSAMRQRAGEIKPIDEVLLAVKEVAFGKCSIVTSAYSSAVLSVLRRSRHYKDGMFCPIKGRELYQRKSDKFRAILAEKGLSSSEVLSFGDMVSDLLYSREAGIPFCAVGWGYHPLRYLSAFNPDFSVESPKELRHFLTQWQEYAKNEQVTLTN